MPHRAGENVSRGQRRRAIRQIQGLIAAGIADDEARDQIMERFNVTDRTVRSWTAAAYREMAADAQVDREKLVGIALRRRRMIMARAAKDGDWKTALSAADSESRLLGLNAPQLTETRVIVDKVSDMSKAMVDVVKEYFADDPAGRDRFVQMLRARVNAQMAQRSEKMAVVIEAEGDDAEQIEAGEVVEATVVQEAQVPPASPTTAESNGAG